MDGMSPNDENGDVDSQLEAALPPVRSDLANTIGLTFIVREEHWSDHPDQRTAWLAGDSGGGVGIFVMAGESAPAQVAAIADQVQEWAIEELWGQGRSATWPVCPEHPKTHSLKPVVHDGVAVWCCPVSLAVVSAIGSLGYDG